MNHPSRITMAVMIASACVNAFAKSAFAQTFVPVTEASPDPADWLMMNHTHRTGRADFRHPALRLLSLSSPGFKQTFIHGRGSRGTATVLSQENRSATLSPTAKAYRGGAMANMTRSATRTS